jgi:serine/threonine protein kinase
VKPANVLVAKDLEVVKLADFSISSLLPEEDRAFVKNCGSIIKGTAAYMSPEQVKQILVEKRLYAQSWSLL